MKGRNTLITRRDHSCMTLGKQIKFIDTFCLTEKNLQFVYLKAFKWDVLATVLPIPIALYWFNLLVFVCRLGPSRKFI